MKGFVVFATVGPDGRWTKLDRRRFGQALPKGSVPIWAENLETGIAQPTANIPENWQEEFEQYHILSYLEEVLRQGTLIKDEYLLAVARAEFICGGNAIHQVLAHVKLANSTSDVSQICSVISQLHRAGVGINHKDDDDTRPLDEMKAICSECSMDFESHPVTTCLRNLGALTSEEIWDRMDTEERHRAIYGE